MCDGASHSSFFCFLLRIQFHTTEPRILQTRLRGAPTMMNLAAQEPHQVQDAYPPSASYAQSFQNQLSARPVSQPAPSGLAPPQRIQQHQVLNPLNQQTPPNYPAYPSSHPHPQQFNNIIQIPSVAPNQPNFHPHPTPQQHNILNYNQAGHVYPKPNNQVPHQLSPNPPAPQIVRPSQQQMAQQLMNNQAHIRSQRLMQQHQQALHQQRQDEVMMTCDPLDYYTTRSSALRRYTNNHVHMNSVLGTHWTVNQLLREDHIRILSKRKPVDPPDSTQLRKERLRQKIHQIESDIETSKLIHQAQLNRIQS
ncbi:hypothetical protein PCASD_13927 [Puccinia coronata f. sp. avenae]|uniref:Uncharacterized protein n=1 Tax=Puccinia coronata f. sp. avenae TaxID=200324 RepID=A0A2N5S281_9BASI|nr:hypothetical protein PCASD_23519 [Puccinia coronata f. sp. avenae]PLW37137.1 hypothetical protein PCASD_13927 [Puccinia coronata f. sp. avenae]